MKGLPSWLLEKIASPPLAGTGLHGWLFDVARQLHAHMPEAAIVATLTAATAAAGRVVTAREIADAARNSKAVAWGQKEAPRATSTAKPAEESPSERWPAYNAMAARGMAGLARKETGIGGCYDLWEANRPPDWTVDDWMDFLFPDAKFLCLAEDANRFWTRDRARWYFTADELAFVVPSAMSALAGKTKNGHFSARSNANTGPRQWLAIEFDRAEIPPDMQACLHLWLGMQAESNGWPPLKLMVHSGGKSIHGWYHVNGAEAAAKSLMSYAISLGADAATWTPSQLVRLPEGRRKRKEAPPNSLPEGWEDEPTIRQGVLYFKP